MIIYPRNWHGLVCAILILSLFGCRTTPPPVSQDTDLLALVQQIENPDINNRLILASFEHTVRTIVAQSAQTQALIAKGGSAAAYVTPRFNRTNLSNRDYALAHYAYVIEQLGYKEALPTLNKFLAEARNRETLVWAIVFAEHARNTLESHS